AVAWVTTTPARQSLLWLYDAQTDQMTVRSLSVSPPFGEASAAAVALTLKTLLRSTAIAPEAERPSPEVGTATAAPTSASSSTAMPTSTSTTISAPTSTTSTSTSASMGA